MKVYRGVKYRLYPTDEQIEVIEKTFECCRQLWNKTLAHKLLLYEQCKTNVTIYHTEHMRECDGYKEIDNLALMNVCFDLEDSFKKYLNGVDGRPKFKSWKNPRRSYRTINKSGLVKIEKGYIELPVIGKVVARGWFERENNGIYSVTVKRYGSGKYYASVNYIVDKTIKPVVPRKVIGLDYKANGLFMDSDGNVAKFRDFNKEAAKKLRREHRHLTRRIGARKGEKKSKNYIKQERKYAECCQKVANRREDFLHKMSRKVVNSCDAVCIEDISMKGIAKKKQKIRFAKSTYENAYYQFTQYLNYKLKDAGKVLVKIPRYYPSSQICSKCGTRNDISLDQRVFYCPKCYKAIDRDLNAARNIRNKGREILFDNRI